MNQSIDTDFNIDNLMLIYSYIILNYKVDTMMYLNNKVLA